MDKIAEFERIEGIVKNPPQLRSLTKNEAQALADSLAANVPPSSNPAFFERVRRVESALHQKLAQELAWWQRPWGAIAIAIFSAVVSAAATKLLGLSQ